MFQTGSKRIIVNGGPGSGIRGHVTSKKDPKTMTAGEINRELDSLDKKSSSHTDKMIAAGRGYEKHNETMTKAATDPTDELAQEHALLTQRHSDLRYEVDARMGPGYHPRLPGGRMFGPRY
jgi:hypothetical protein